ncbi:MAG TPA: type I restriction endonuclease subunit R [Candidatus Acidoferrales bacterium]|nr:type I restriction endonuclease subunit R [Candidatus Acidoferrales bacterium]
MTAFTESTVEDAALEIFEGLRYTILHGPAIAPGEMFAERASYGDVVLLKRLREALARINPQIPADAIEDAIRKLLRTESPSLVENNRRFHRFLTDGLPVEYRREDRTVHDSARLFDFDTPENNDWIAINQLTIEENRRNRRPDVIVFVNGLPLAVIELKNLADENATIRDAFNQFQTYKSDIPSLFPYNELLVISDGIEARLGTLTAGWERFMPWRTIEGDKVAPKGSLEMEVLLRGVFEKKRFLDLVRNFVVFEQNGKSAEKKLGGYHQFHAVNKAVERTLDAASLDGDRRAGVVWHTQGSGKSLTMAFYAGKIIQHPAMSNPTLVVLTDRNDLDDQLFGTFSACKGLLRQTPEQAESRDNLQELLRRSAGGVIFTTIQKFLLEDGTEYPQLSDRRNIVVIADEAHRSQYGFIEGFARHMRNALPNASFIGFTATPIESGDRSTPAVFGDYIDIYDIQRAVEDGATVRIYYEGRLAKLELDEDERPKIDPEFEEVTEGEEDTVKRNLMSKWSRMEAMVGTPKRVGLIARDVVDHFAKRLEAMEGKAMIVCMSRRICVDLYNALVKLRPEWHNEDEDKGSLKVVMTGSASDRVEWQGHIRGGKARRELLANRFKDPNNALKVAIVRDMWLTGFDVPCLHTMYVDKPMQRHGLMQAIARVNRVFKDKPGGLIVDYLGLATQLQKAVSDYTESGGKGEPVEMQERAVEKMLELYEICAGMMHGFNYSPYKTGSPKERTAVIPAAAEHVLQQEDGKKRFMGVVSKLSKAFALSVPHEKAIAIRDDVGFFQAVRVGLAKTTPSGGKNQEDLDSAVRQIVSKAVASDEVIDIFSAAGLKRPDISILSDQFLSEVKDLPHKNLAIETLRKLLSDEIKGRARKNLVQSRQFSEMLEESIRKYQNRSLQAAQVIQELIDLAKDMRQAHERGEKLGLSDDELAFYDALETNDSAVQVLGDDTLKRIALELLDTVRKNATIDWTVKESVRAKLRVMVKRVLRKYDYPPDKQEKATQTVLQQAELLSKDWAA